MSFDLCRSLHGVWGFGPAQNEQVDPQRYALKSTELDWFVDHGRSLGEPPHGRSKECVRVSKQWGGDEHEPDEP